MLLTKPQSHKDFGLANFPVNLNILMTLRVCYVGGLRKCEDKVGDLLALEIHVEEMRKRVVLMSSKRCTRLVGALEIVCRTPGECFVRLELGLDGRGQMHRRSKCSCPESIWSVQ